jgi:hypothetical protein
VVFITGAESHTGLIRFLGTERPDDLTPVFALNRYVGDMSDHHVFRQHGVPFLFFSCGRWPDYHQPTDTPDLLNFSKMAALASWLTSLVKTAAALPLPPAIASGDPSLALETRSFRQAFGDFMPMICEAIGISDLTTRPEMDQIAAALTGDLNL